MHELGTGVLDWEREERVSDRYGTVELLDGIGEDRTPVRLARVREHLHGSLVAIVKDIRAVGHIGDFFHRIKPSVPNVGDRFVLGTGGIFFDECGVGIRPDDGRATLWLDILALYRVHNQTVTLYFEESMNL